MSRSYTSSPPQALPWRVEGLLYFTQVAVSYLFLICSCDGLYLAECYLGLHLNGRGLKPVARVALARKAAERQSHSFFKSFCVKNNERVVCSNNFSNSAGLSTCGLGPLVALRHPVQQERTRDIRKREMGTTCKKHRGDEKYKQKCSVETLI
jgi:hypothetical protein